MTRNDRTVNRISGVVHGPVVQAGHVTLHAPEPDVLTRAADRLALAVGVQWRREEEQRRLHDPFPLPVHWNTAPEGTADCWENVLGLPPGEVAEPLVLSDRLGGIADAHGATASRRLVVLGGAGSGKTVLALRFVLDLLARRGPDDPVPVVFSLGSWNPTGTPLREWLVARLVRDHPGLAVRGPDRRTLAAGLVDTDRVLPVLDGFDEISYGLHRAALEALNGTSLPLLLTSRPEEYADAVAATDVLTAAACVVLADLTPDDLAAYLRRATATGAWEPVLAEVRRDPGSDLASVLTTPLMVTLARAAYSDAPDRDPAELLDRDRFPDEEAIEEHLLDGFVPSVYRAPTRWTPDQARHRLHHLARQCGDTRDLAWWRIGTAMGRPARALVVGTACGVGVALLNAVLNLLGYLALSGSGVPLPIGPALAEALVNGLVVGTGVGIAHLVLVRDEGVRPTHTRMRLARPRDAGGGLTRSGTGLRLLVGTAVGGAFGIAGGVVLNLLRHVISGAWTGLGTDVVNTVVLGLVFAVATGLALVAVTVFEAPLEIASAAGPTDLRNAGRANVLGRSLLFGVVYGVAITAGAWSLVRLPDGASEPLFFGPVAVLRMVLLSGLSCGLCYCLALTAWGQWVLFARTCLPLAGRLPRSLPAFLDDATRRGVLRQAGAVHQFRHARLQDRLLRTAP
ncbi:NACHT domain-containing protein [Saccharothrix sp. Mg75]|uniref:NACHT domain-containing protein n=1 Tax=Saccharothrix sp. Mg75 TaxID=3445357 RepID=UPI003EEE7BF2